jgi:hypothetical protein
MSDLHRYYVLSMGHFKAAVDLLGCVGSKLQRFDAILEMKLNRADRLKNSAGYALEDTPIESLNFMLARN